jgi:transcriptional regulator with XRE-family HTH domain
MTFKKDIIIEDEFKHLFEFKNDYDEIEHEASMLMFKFLSEIEIVNNNRFSKKELGKLIGTSPSYITQLFRGDKLINMLTLAKFQKALGIEFDVIARSQSEENTFLEFDPKDYHLQKPNLLDDQSNLALVYVNPEKVEYKSAC